MNVSKAINELNEQVNRLRGDWRNWAMLLLAGTTVLFFCLWWFHQCQPCAEGENTTIATKIVYRDTSLHKAQSNVKLIKRKPVAHQTTVVKADSTFCSNSAGNSSGNSAGAATAACDEWVNYSTDTIYDEVTKVKVVIDDEYRNNWVYNRKVYTANLKPEVTITKTVKEKWKVYLGPSVTIPQYDLRRWDIGLSGAVTVPKVGMISYGYGFRNGGHTISLMPLLRFKK